MKEEKKVTVRRLSLGFDEEMFMIENAFGHGLGKRVRRTEDEEAENERNDEKREEHRC